MTMGVNDVCLALMSPELSAVVPEIKPRHESIRLLAFGDFGDGGDDQRAVAAGMAQYDEDHPFDFGLTLGDNFYEQGLNKPDHPRWSTHWDELYNRLGIRIYATLGNHDYGDLRSPNAEIARSALPQNQSWCLPKPYYTFMAGPVQFFAIDTTPVDKPSLDGKGPTRKAEQREWLEKALASSHATWKVVYGHHPIYTNGDHGGDRGELALVKDYLLPLIKNKADIYLAGHDHDLQALKPEGGVAFFVAGGGGKDTRPLRTSQCRAWAESIHGFAVLEAAADELAVRFFDAEGKALHAVSWKKGQPPADCSRD
jgi:hypothetical protein